MSDPARYDGRSPEPPYPTEADDAFDRGHDAGREAAEFDLSCAREELTAAQARIKELEEALAPFAKIKPSSLYPPDGSEAEGYIAVLRIATQDFTGADLARARAAIAESTPTEGDAA